MDKTRKNVALLSTCQGLLLTNNSVLITINALAGYAIAPNKAIATLPVTTYFLGSAATTLPMSFLMKRFGRRTGFTLGAVFAILGSVLCAWGIYHREFWLMCGGTFVLGAYFAAGQYYRFAAADAAAPDFKSKAISLVLAGGIVGGFLGPETSKLTKDMITGHPYVGPYFILIGFALLAICVLRWLDIPRLSEVERKAAGRPLAQIVAQPAFLVAVLCGMVGYGVMNFLMTATPLAMVACQHPFGDAAFVIQWHILGMFAPSFFTGSLIQRFGLLRIMMTGVALNGVCVAIALSGVEVVNFWAALMLLGVGWNFMYVGATTLLTETHTPVERAKVQGINDFTIFFTMVASSLGSGALFSAQGWQTMNMAAVPFLGLAAAGLIWLAIRRRRTPQAA
ncbi:MAG TPA: MFS transporter [Burkholderiales bacterium]|nr:MFS transporter [Burkholderiales bacterium]